ncbi:helix-turn-helix domain-containing protein [Actinomycetes bacterium KLBMP 9759]
MSLREQRRAETQAAIQSHAVRLFTERGYDATTVNDVAAAAGVSPMTLYRHFPTKEDLVLHDQHNRLVAERIAATPVGMPLVRRIGRSLVESVATLDQRFLLARLQLMITAPALRAKHLDNNYTLQQAIVQAVLGERAADRDADFRAQAAASACLAAMHIALVRWAAEDGRPDLPALIAEALVAAFGEEVMSVPGNG